MLTSSSTHHQKCGHMFFECIYRVQTRTCQTHPVACLIVRTTGLNVASGQRMSTTTHHDVHGCEISIIISRPSVPTAAVTCITGHRFTSGAIRARPSHGFLGRWGLGAYFPFPSRLLSPVPSRRSHTRHVVRDAQHCHVKKLSLCPESRHAHVAARSNCACAAGTDR